MIDNKYLNMNRKRFDNNSQRKKFIIIMNAKVTTTYDYNGYNKITYECKVCEEFTSFF